jgi:M6 family metalloprotease-like protein
MAGVFLARLETLIGGIMKKFLAAIVGLSILIFGLTPAQAETRYVANQKTLSAFTASATGLTAKQRAEVKAAVEANPYAEKFICTGIRYVSQPMSENIKVRKRAKAACEYAKQLNPALSTWFQNKPTQARSYAGKVLLTIKVPADKANAVPAGYVETDAIDWDINPAYKEGEKCGSLFGWQVLGLNKKNQPAFLKCNGYPGSPNRKFAIDSKMPKIDPKTKKPLISKTVPATSLFGYSPNVYIEPTIVTTLPKTSLSSGPFNDYPQCKVAEGGDGSPDKSYGFPLPAQREKLKEGFKILVVPVQFTDHRTSNKPAEDMADVVSALTKYYTRASSVPISFDWTIPTTYYQMGKTIDSFNLSDWDRSQTGSFYDRYEPYLEAALALADDDYNFNDFDVVVVEEPRSVTNDEHPSYIPHAQENGGRRVDTKDGEVKSILVTGNDELRDIPNWIHEFGHLLGLGDRNWNTDATPGFDLMFGWYGSPELSAWNRWLLEILKDEQVDCKTDSAKTTHLVQPVAWVGDYKKAVVIPISEFEVLVIESRRRQGFDALFGKESEGAYVYRIDTSAKMYQPDNKVIVDVVAPSRSKPIMSWALDASLKLGESVTSDGWTIKVIETGAFGDVIEVSKNG